MRVGRRGYPLAKYWAWGVRERKVFWFFEFEPVEKPKGTMSTCRPKTTLYANTHAASISCESGSEVCLTNPVSAFASLSSLSLLNDLSLASSTTSHRPYNGLNISQGRLRERENLRIQGMPSSVPMATEVRVLALYGTGKRYRNATTIDMLTDNVLVEIFDFCRKDHDPMSFWPRLEMAFTGTCVPEVAANHICITTPSQSRNSLHRRNSRQE
ncbi:hypothetical protein EDB89DRAFT_1366314 [Lactarius sanguifluus]|nr:hypothetical protein EDB89DRAFT_1366314 [Lactarius sanguifluus]